ncbi:hypothetical protein Goarm_009160 [Gossypium armourianum]|uniref:Uncharacterized protein n=1 Tax=Gossypium armourianum TaxID=34283 RepID=A0A7J9JS18_9ROSI|nr:hypothetical protein [Gossypium armourianum]
MARPSKNQNVEGSGLHFLSMPWKGWRIWHSSQMQSACTLWRAHI